MNDAGAVYARTTNEASSIDSIASYNVERSAMARNVARRALLGLSGAATLVALAGCAAGKLDSDWLETKTLQASRDRHGDYVRVANEMMARQEYDLALRAYTRAIKDVGVTGEVIGGIGAANAQLDRMNQAHRYLDRGTQIAPHSVSVWNNLGVVLWHSGDKQAGRAAFEVAMHISEQPDAAVAANIEADGGRPPDEDPASSNLTLRHSSGLFLIVEEAPQDGT